MASVTTSPCRYRNAVECSCAVDYVVRIPGAGEEARRGESEFRRAASRVDRSLSSWQFRRSAEFRNIQGGSGNSAVASQSTGSENVTMRGGSVESQQRQDPLIYPGLYSPSGFDMMGILVSF
jgi:hypothetical protein